MIFLIHLNTRQVIPVPSVQSQRRMEFWILCKCNAVSIVIFYVSVQDPHGSVDMSLRILNSYGGGGELTQTPDPKNCWCMYMVGCERLQNPNGGQSQIISDVARL